MKLIAHLALVASIGAVSVAAARSSEIRNISDIYAAAQKETGTLQVAWGGDEKSQSAGIAQAFQSAFPLIKVNFTSDLSKYHDGRINRQLQGGDFYADVAIIQTLHDFDIWKAGGHLLNYKPLNFDKLWAQFTDPNGAFIPVSGASFGPFVFKTASVAPQDIPRSYADVLDPKWKGKLVLTYPNDDDAVLYNFVQIVQKYGWDWVRKLAQQDVQWVRGTATGALVINSTAERTLTFSSFPLGPDWSYVPPTTDRYMSWFQTSAIFKTTKMPETARLLQSFFVSDTWQRGLIQRGQQSSRIDLSNGTAIFQANNTDFTTFKPFMKQRDVVEAWRFQFEDILGTAQGLSPLIDNIGS
ncbi:Hypothetical protein D9617_24g016620 [Elsinoe fawcettii]|nr:Hypothetical protein D9617_24g016620 [Elsinoe fawcettii]